MTKEKRYYYTEELIQKALNEGKKVWGISPIRHLLSFVKMWKITANNLSRLMYYTSTLRCPSCRNRLEYSIGYHDGRIYARCINRGHIPFTNPCMVGTSYFHFTLTEITSQEELDEKYKGLKNRELK